MATQIDPVILRSTRPPTSRRSAIDPIPATKVDPTKPGMSTATKVGLGVGALAVLLAASK